MTTTEILALIDKHTTTGTMPGESWLNRTAFAVELSLIINKPKFMRLPSEPINPNPIKILP